VNGADEADISVHPFHIPTTSFMSNQPEIGKGIYTRKDISTILQMKYHKVNRWVTSYAAVSEEHSWKTGESLAVDFVSLVEFSVIGQLLEAGVKPTAIVKARKILQKHFSTDTPFTLRPVLEGLTTDSRRICFRHGDQELVHLDGTAQLNLGYVRDFMRNLEFDKNLQASRFWPLGKEHSIVVDPARKFGHPVLANRNIYPETLFQLIKGGETVDFVSELYGLNLKEVHDAIAYCTRAA
jgi:uncharacterized protein (DUF433 family)